MLLVILCGIPCAGKTQLAIILARELELAHGLRTIVVDPDRIRQMIPALESRFDPERESFVNSLALALIEQSLQQNNIVISDDLNYFESARHRLVQIARKHHVGYVILYLTVSTDTAQRRNAARGLPIPQDVISVIAEKFDHPGDKYRWDRPAVVLDSEKLTPDQMAKPALELLLNKINDKPAKAETERTGRVSKRTMLKNKKASAKSILDESTRRILNNLFSSGELDRKSSKNASKMRREFVEEASRKNTNIKDALQEFEKRAKKQFT